MTPNEHDTPETQEELGSTDLSPFSADPPKGADRAIDDTLPDLPAMEQLPNPDALPDPGYPVMPTTARDHASGTVESPEGSWPADEPGAQTWPRPPEWAPEPPQPSFHPVQPHPVQANPDQEAQPSQPSQLSQPVKAPRQVWSPDPYAAPRAPDDAPPLHGPSVPWSEVRAAADHEATPEPLAAPPKVRAQAATAGGPVAAPPEDLTPRPTSDVLTSELLLPGKRATPDGGWRRTVYRATGGLVHIGESSASMRRRDLVSRVRTPITGGLHRVAVLSLKGGVGKTTVTVGLGATLASLRGDRVIAVDANPDRGTLSDKVRLETPATIRDLLDERAMIGRYADVRAFTSQSSSRLEILASDRDPGVSVAFSADDYRAVVGVLEHYYSICITDCGTGLLHSAMAGILELADQVVLVSSPSVDGARSASATLDWLDAHDYGDLVRGGVVVLSAIRRKSKSAVDLDRLEQHFALRCRAVVRIPYDPHLEEGAEVDLDYLNSETAESYLTLAALVADAFAYPGRSAARAAQRSPLA
ncbi:MAG TPA: AAA family ATPase [Trebonia sp.]|jgi:MinD-like ATPase involved in chromosome partitioning or flagellar assembly|nr:AAA family ATPase [Trebonia sp.]